MWKTAEERDRVLHKLLEELLPFGFSESFINSLLDMAEVISEVGRSLKELSEAMISEDYNSDIRQRRFLERKYRSGGRCSKPKTKAAFPYRINIFRIQHRGCC